MKRTATKKNVKDFLLKNPHIRENINAAVMCYMDETLIQAKELPYDKIIKELVRRHEGEISLADVYLYLNEFTNNGQELYKLNIYNKTGHYISELKRVCKEIYLDLCKDSTQEIKLSDKIELTDDLYSAITDFVTEHIVEWQKIMIALQNMLKY